MYLLLYEGFEHEFLLSCTFLEARLEDECHDFTTSVKTLYFGKPISMLLKKTTSNIKKLSNKLVTGVLCWIRNKI